MVNASSASAWPDMRTSLILILAVALAVPAAAAGTAVGTVTHLSGLVSVQHADGSARVLSVSSAIVEGDLLTTEADTFARVKFVDGGEVVLLPNTRFKVETYRFDPADASTDNVLLRLLKGGLRAVSGLIGKRSRDHLSYGTVVATIGIRGTNHGMLLCQDDCGAIPTASGTPPANGLHLDVASGAIVVSNGGGAQQFAAGQFGFVAGPASAPILLPPGQGIQVTMPQSIAADRARGRSPGGAERDTACAL